MSTPFRTVVLLMSAALGLGACGGDASHSGGHSDAAASTGASLDRAFVAAMVPHHEGAIEMAELAADRAEDPFVRQLAADILASQQKEIDAMRAADERLAGEAGVGDLGVPGHRAEDLSSLREAEDFDVAFVRMMIPHHESAIPMARAEIDKGADSGLKRVATGIIAAQEREIAEMRAFLERRGATAGSHGSAHSPPGAGGAHPAHAQEEER